MVGVTTLAHTYPALYWESTYAIALALIEQHTNRHPESVGLHELANLVIQLPGFQDDPTIVTEQTLLDIQNVWYEEMTNL
jgi:FeS assembly protein IscX